MPNSHHNIQNWILLLLLTFIWGTSYILIKKGLMAFSPIELAALRVSISFLCSLPFAIMALRTIPRHQYFTILQIGIFGSGVPAFLFALSMTKSSSSVNGILNSLSPLWTLIIGYYIYQVHISRQKVMGVIIGFLGAIVLVLGGGGENPVSGNSAFEINVIYSFLPVIATFCYGMSSNITKQRLQNESPVYTTSLAMSMIGIPAFIILLFTHAPAKIIAGDAWMSLTCIALLSIFGTVIAWMLFYRLIQRTDALFGASVTYLIPVVAISWGMFDGEVLSLLQIGGMGLILAGVSFTTKR